MKKVIAIALALLLLFALTACSNTNSGNNGDTQAQGNSSGEWPTKPITLLCGYSAGGSSDLGCRYLAEALREELGQPVVVENVPGSGSWVCWNQLLQTTDKDGYTFALVNLSALYGHYDETNPREYTIDDFELMANHVIDYQVLCIRNDETRFTDYASFVDYAKNNNIIFAAATNNITSGDGTVAKMLEVKHGCKITVIPVDGASDATTMFLAGETDILSANVGDVMEAEENGYKPIVIFAPERSSYLPDCPTSAETGVDDYVSFSARGYAYMKGVDPKIVERMTEALSKAFENEKYQEQMAAMGAQTKLYTGQEYKDLLTSQLDSRLEIWGISK